MTGSPVLTLARAPRTVPNGPDVPDRREAGHPAPGPPDGPDALTVYDRALRRAAAGRPVLLRIADSTGAEHVVDPAAWCRRHVPGDAELLARCTGAILDVGCGPGRLAGALGRRGEPALGIDVSAVAVRLARRRGVRAIRRDVFGPVPGTGRWRHVLLADGNIGIAGHPVALLRRCRALLGPAGQVHVELTAPGGGSWAGWARLRADGTENADGFENADGSAASAPFRWASVAVDDIAELAAGAGLRTLDTWTAAGRWFASLAAA